MIKTRLLGMCGLLASLAAGGATLLTAGPAAAQAFPSRPITIIYPYGSGSSADVLLRMQVQEVSKALGQPVLVDLRSGANGRLGPQGVINSKGNPYLYSFVADSTLVIEPLRDPTFVLAPGKEYTPIASAYLGPYILTISSTIPPRDVAALLAYSKANAGKVNFGVGQVGGSAHMGMVLLNDRYNTGYTSIYYKGEGQLVPAMLSGEAQVALLAPAWKAHLDSGRLVGLAVTTEKRIPQFPNVPTVKEAGLPFLNNWGFWVGIIGPADLPRDVVTRMNRTLNEANRVPEIAKKIADSGYQLLEGTPEEFLALIRTRSETMAPLISKVKVD